MNHDFPFIANIADLDQLNRWALMGNADVCKVSFATYAKLQHLYNVLPVGAAMGFGNGPKIIASKAFDPVELHKMRIATPGKDTTAYKLYRHFLPHAARERVCLYNEVEGLVKSGEVDAGIIIHESRFTFRQQGLVEIVDLGTLWEERMQLPLPLGGLIYKKALNPELVAKFCKTLQESLQWARENPAKVWPYVLSHSVEKDEGVVAAHVDLYVNQETLQLSEQGREAIRVLVNL